MEPKCHAFNALVVLRLELETQLEERGCPGNRQGFLRKLERRGELVKSH